MQLTLRRADGQTLELHGRFKSRLPPSFPSGLLGAEVACHGMHMLVETVSYRDDLPDHCRAVIPAVFRLEHDERELLDRFWPRRGAVHVSRVSRATSDGGPPPAEVRDAATRIATVQVMACCNSTPFPLRTPRGECTDPLELRAWLHDPAQQATRLPSADVERAWSCSICLEGASAGEVLGLPCEHRFHARCLQRWSGPGRGCPLCRCALPPNCTGFVDFGVPRPAAWREFAEEVVSQDVATPQQLRVWELRRRRPLDAARFGARLASMARRFRELPQPRFFQELVWPAVRVPRGS